MIKKVGYAYVGLLVYTFNKSKDLAIKIAEQAKHPVQTMQSHYKTMPHPMQMFNERKSQLERHLDEGVHKALESMGVPTQEDLQKLYAKMQVLTDKVKQLVKVS